MVIDKKKTRRPFCDVDVKWYDKFSDRKGCNRKCVDDECLSVPVHEKIHKISGNSLDKELKNFVDLCISLEDCISNLTTLRDSPRTDEEYFEFKRSISDFKHKAIVEAYNRDCFMWKI